ncbi:hypothetical protein M2347_003760 [Chryseobacterium sp. H1D6B]|uniref:hypothetical protein n=1 Tax=Chryseobacterium sp. H1D6B TaxID=2940588 RepID=UPI0015CCE25D|nr:hypothetical protein [Chryseobacterium sp. H1D6B]MDH6254033.1 hypothetical protein [Chryseobacterium sp. H1D6B]
MEIQHCNNIKENVSKGLFFLSIILFLISLFQPAFFIDKKNADAYSNSLFLFCFGWMSFLGGAFIPFIIWLANPLYLVSIILIYKNFKIGIITLTMSVILSVAFANLDTILSSESGAVSKITELGAGFYLWMASFIVLLICSIFKAIKPN